jgi:trigger factor
MQVTIEEVSPVEKKMAVEIPWERVREKLDEAYRELARGVTLRGFRKGKVPREIMERMFGRKVEGEVRKQLIQESFISAIAEHHLEPVAEPAIDAAELRRNDAFRFSARVEVRTAIDIQPYADLTVTRRAAKVSDQDVERALRRKQMEMSERRPVEGRDDLGASDIVLCDIEGTLGGEKVGSTDVAVDLSRTEDQVLPGLGQALLGMPRSAQQHEIRYTVPDDDPRKEMAGKSAELRVTVKAAYEQKVPALDDDFAKDTGEADSLDELRDKLRDKLLVADRRAAERELRSQLVKRLLERHPFEVAPSLVERQLDVVVQRAHLGLALSGIDPTGQHVDQQKLREELRQTARDDVRSALLLTALAKKEQVEVTEADVEKRIAELAQARGQSAARLRAELQRAGSTEGGGDGGGRLDEIRASLLEEKTLDLVLSRVSIAEGAVDGGEPPAAAAEPQPSSAAEESSAGAEGAPPAASEPSEA